MGSSTLGAATARKIAVRRVARLSVAALLAGAAITSAQTIATAAARKHLPVAKIVVKHGPAPVAAKKKSGAVAAERARPAFAPAPAVVDSLNFGNVAVGGTPVTMTLSFPIVSKGASSVVAAGGVAPGSASDYIFFGNSNVEFGGSGGGQPSNLTNFTVNTLTNVEYPGNGNYTQLTAPGGDQPFTTGSLTENPTNYPNTTPHTQLLATFSPNNAGSFTVYILDGNTDGVYVGNSSVGLGKNGGTAVTTVSHVQSGGNEFTRYNVSNAQPSDLFQVYATTSTNAYPTIGGLTFVMGLQTDGLTAATTANQDFKVSSTNCNNSGCTAQVVFAPGYPGLRYDAVNLMDGNGNIVNQTYIYGVGMAPQFGYELGNLTLYYGFLDSPQNVVLGPDESIYFTTTGSNVVQMYARDFSNSNQITFASLENPAGIVVDGSNTIFVADKTQNQIVYQNAAGVQGRVTTSPLNGPAQLAIDGTGSLYIADTGNNRVIEIDNQGNETTIASGLSSPTAVAVDSAGDVFIGDTGTGGEILEVTPGATSPTTFVNNLSLIPVNLAIDASGTVYLTSLEQGLNLYRSNGQNEYGYATGSDIPYGLAVDRNGDIFQTNPLKSNPSQFTQLDRSSSNFILDTAPTTTTMGGLTIANTGNMPLTITNFTTTGPEFEVFPISGNCTPPQVLAAATTCDVNISFTPPEAQYYTDTMEATSNSLNAAATLDPFYLAGNGLGAPSTIALSAAPTSVQVGNPVQFFATVTDTTNTYTPTGMVTFMDSGVSIGSAPLAPGAQPYTGTVQFTTSSLSVGTHNITAVYAGDLNVDNNTSSGVNVTVYSGTPPPNGGLLVSTMDFGSIAVGTVDGGNSIALDSGVYNAILEGNTDFNNFQLRCETTCYGANLTFSPLFPGLRTDTILEYDNNNNLIGKIYLTGTGTGPQFGFDPGTDTVFHGNVAQPTAITYGQDGTLYIADKSTNQVYAAAAGTNALATALPVVNLGTIGGVAVDASKVIYVTDQTHNLIVTYDQVAKVQGSVPTDQLSSPGGVVVDGKGGLYVADIGNNRVIRIDNKGNETIVVSNVPATLGPIALDSAGNFYYTITAVNGGGVIEIPVGGGQPITISNSTSDIHGIAVDAGGRVYYTNDSGLSAIPLQNCGNCSIEGLGLAGSQNNYITALALDPAGDIFVTQPSDGNYIESVRSTGNTLVVGPVGSTTQGPSFQVSNTGNMPLTLGGMFFHTAGLFSVDPSSTCTNGSILQVQQICEVVPDFTPPQPQQYVDPLTLNSNSLNSNESFDVFTAFGTGVPAGGGSGTTTLGVSSNSIQLGQSVTLSATVTGATMATPTGTVSFYNGSTLLGSGALAPLSTPGTASATCSAYGGTVGTWSVTASYAGDGNNPPSTSAAQTVTVTRGSTSTTLVASSTNLSPGADETLTATVAALATPQASGTVSFFDGTNQVGSVNLIAGTNGGTATLDLGTNVAGGTHSYTAVYSGDTNYLQSTSAAVSVTAVSTIVSSLNYGSVAVGSSVTMQVTIGGNGTITIIDGAEFAPTSNPNCTTSCTISITFTPKYPGLRTSAATVTDGSGNVLGRTFLYGLGTAGQFAFDPTYNQPTTPYSAGNVTGIAVGADGSIFVSDTVSNTVTAYAPGGSSSTIPLGNIGKVGAIAVDGAFTAYVVDQVNEVVISSTVTGVVSTVHTSPLGGNGSQGPAAIAVDGTGALYIDDTFHQRIIKIDNQGNETTLVSSSNVTNSTGMAVDAAADVFYTDVNGSNGIIKELPPGGSLAVVASGLSTTVGALALDPAGRFYYLSSSGTQSLLNGLSPGNIQGGSFSAPALLSTGGFTALSVSPAGAILAGDKGTGGVDVFDRMEASYNATAVVGAMSRVTFPISNTGDATLTLSGLAFVNGTGFSIDSASACVVGSAIAPAGVCQVTVDFTPPNSGSFQSNLSVASNTLNTPDTTNIFSFTGQGVGLTSTTTLAASTTTPTVGQAVTFTASVTDGSMTAPTGTVQFLDGSTVIGTSSLSATSTPGHAQAQFTTSALTVGSHGISAAYGGFGIDQASTSGAQTVVVSQAGLGGNTITLATSAGNPTAYEVPISLQATVKTSQSAPITVGQVIFCDTSLPRCSLLSNLGTAQLNSAGVATLRIYPGTVGNHSYSAMFLGTSAYLAAATTSSPQVTVAGLYPTVTTITSTGSVGSYSLTGAVAGVGSFSLAPTSSVSFIDTSNGNAMLGSALLGSATYGFSEVQPTGSPVTVGREPYGVTSADFNGDGFLDIVTGNYGANTITVAFGNGDGTFQPPATYTVQADPERVLTADFNGDGHPDIVVANTGSNTVSVLLNNGDGTFATQVTYAAASPVGLGVMDVNHDGIADIVASDYYANTVSVLLGNGDGTFRTGVTYPTGNTPQTMAEGDFNGDGNIDLVVGNYGDNNVSIFLGNGDGTFQSHVNYAVGGNPQGVQVGDFNGDGIADLAVSNSGPGTVSVLLGNGDGTFRTQVTYPVGQGPVGLVIADFNGDGKQDISVGNTGQSSLTQSILLGNGDGTFQTQLTYPTGNFPYGVATGDYNGDGYPDMVISNFSAGTATILLSQITESATATITGVALGGTAGQHTVDAVYAGDANFKTSTSAAISLTSAGSGPSPQTITFPTIPNHTFGDAPFTLSATASSGLAVSYAVTSGPATVSGSTVTLTGAGSVTIQATQAGNASYAAATPVSQSFAVAQAAQTIAFPAIPNHAVSDPPFPLSATASSGLTVSYAVTSGPATVSGNTVTITGSGTVLIQATQAGNTNYLTASPVSQSFAVSTSMQTITFPAIPNHTFGDAPFTLGATASSGLTVSYAVTSGPATVSGSTVTLTGAGSVTIRATQAGNTSYAAATPVSQSYTVSAASQTITFPAIPNHTFGDAPFSLGAIASSGLTVSYAVTSGSAAVSGSTVTLTGAGTVVIQAIQTGNTNYTAASPVSQSFTVSLASQTITFPAISNHVVTDAPFTLGAMASSGLTVSYAVTSGPATVSGSTVTLTGTGTVVIQATQAGNTAYAAATSVSQSFTVSLASQTITFGAIPNHTFGDAPFTVSATASSGLAVSYAVTSGPATISGNTVTLTGAGSVTIQATQAGNTSYSAATPVSQSFTVAQAAQTITFGAIPNHSVNDAPFAISATASSGLPVAFAVVSGPATIQGNTVTLTGSGTAVIQATQPGNTNYTAAAPLSQSFLVSLVAQTITFQAIPNHTVGDAPFAVSATASSNLSVTFAVTSGPATIASNLITLTGAGTVVITASQAGNSTYAAATPVSQSFAVALQTQTITFPALPNHTFGDVPFTISATATSGLTVSFTVASGPATVFGSTVTITGPGTVVIQATQAGNTTYAAATAVTQSFTVQAPAPTLASITPAGGVVGSGATVITLTGANFIATDDVQLNGAAIATTFVNATTLTATVPAAFLATAGTGQITVIDTSLRASAAQSFSVLAAPAINFSGPTSTISGTQPTLTFQLVNPYPFAIAGTLTLTNAPSGANPIDDPAVQFSSGGRTITFTIPALSQVTPTVQIQSGTVAGVVTITLVVTSNGVNVTPSNVAPVKITIPAAVPTISTATFTRSGSTLTVTVEGFSNTRELTTAIFHFTGVAGSTISTPDITAPVTTAFGTYFSSAASTPYGSTFLYTQVFTLNDDALSIQSVTVTLVNSQGNSIQVTTQ